MFIFEEEDENVKPKKCENDKQEAKYISLKIQILFILYFFNC